MERNTSTERLSGLQHLQFDSEGMLLPHTILGSVEDFRSHLEANGLTDLVQRVKSLTRDPGSDVSGQPSSIAVEKEMQAALGNKESNALRQWNTHMKHRRKQQNILSDNLHRPVNDLLMSKDKHSRETQKKDLLNQTLPFIQTGYNSHVGCEFWNLPDRLGGELSGIRSTLTKTEQGRRKPVSFEGIPNTILQETGTFQTESGAQHQGSYLQQQFEQVEELLQTMDIKQPDLRELEVIGCSGAVCQSPSVEKEETACQEKTTEKVTGSVNPNTLQIPALRFCGKLASWTGKPAAKQGVVGIGGLIIFEVLTGDLASKKMELHNEGSTVIFYNWQKVPVKRLFSCTSSPSVEPHVYFNSSKGVIQPGDTKVVEFIFKSKKPGIINEVWQLNTHPVLLQGALLQVTLKGIVLLKDTTADQRLYIKSKLEKIVARKMCEAILDKVLLGIHSPERPSSPAELYLTEEQRFAQRNPKIQFVHQPVQDLKRLWEQVSPEQTWDLCIDTLRQAVLTLPVEKSNQQHLMREEGLAQLNSLFLQLLEPPTVKHRLNSRAIGQQMMSNLLDTIADEAIQLRTMLNLPQIQAWTDSDDESIASDTGPCEKKGIQKSRKKQKQKKEKPDDVTEDDPEVKRVYTRLMQQKIHALLEDFVENLCDVVDEVDNENSHCI